MSELAAFITERMKHHQVIGFSAVMTGNDELRESVCLGKLDAVEEGEVRRDTRFAACSISKLGTAVLVLALAEQGLFQLDRPINDYLAAWKLPMHSSLGGREASLMDLLSHQAGIVDREGSFDIHRQDERLPPMAEILAGGTRYHPAPVQVTEAPGTAFRYSDAGYCVIQQAIEDRCGKTFETVMDETVFGPLGMTESLYCSPDRIMPADRFASGHERSGARTRERFPVYPFPAAAGLWSTPADLAKLSIEIMRAYRGESKLGLSRLSAKQMLTPQGNSNFAGLGLFLGQAKDDIQAASYGWGVGFQSMLVFHPAKGEGIVLMHNTETGRHQLEGLIGDVLMKLGWR
ncbi:serine hydrolase domain-containing protein [Paenibacillus nanensis]|uniref:serine hydrolase domain-containing protein n=1 Tax=Paenibacillus nanensis TaxID=393251 RepID=UPI0013C353C2|nr:serine hydrolase domain-containing protein [Paenibacillus nanensis]